MSELAEPITQDCVKLIMSKQDYVTGMECCEFKYVWTIKNFRQWAKTMIKSPSFSSHYGDFDDKWILEIYSQFIPNDDAIDDKDGKTKEYNFSKFLENIEWVCCTNRTNVLNPTQYLPNDDLKICSDVIIQVGQKSFRAIKGILAVRSPVFSAMFNHKEFKENEKKKIVIEDIKEDVFEEFLHYIYTDESPNISKMPMELLAVAGKYQVNCLKNTCEKIICKTINFDNVANVFVCSDRYNLKKLNRKCFEFMKRNLRDVMVNKTFQVYKKKYPEIFVGVLEELLLSADSVNYS
ncbi:speckle-type POZ protein-like B [Aphidius gifuensis]|uniref:speckle-type POZ protein-like B n=1 Tax=Aphidius gifuensis TaxID=684658 RepID=UPI001CDCDAEE|nr:speckle-type POZ protein-like B [Aphidius gifuensis]